MPFRIELREGFIILPDTVGFYVAKDVLTAMFGEKKYSNLSINNIHPIGVNAMIVVNELKHYEKIVNA